MNIVFAAGGTGGHFTPAVSVAREIRKANPEASILFMGTGKSFEVEACRAESFDFMTVPSAPLRRGTVLSNLTLPIEVFLGIVGAVRRMNEERTRVLVSMGGYPSVPPFFAAKLLRLPTLVHEQNAEPGIASRIEAFFATEVCLSYERSRNFLRGSAAVTVTGNPAAPSLPEVESLKMRPKKSKPTMLVMGGSQGAHTLNEVVSKYLLESGGRSWGKIYFQTGQTDHEWVSEQLSELSERVIVKPFFHDMREIYKDIDIAVTRAGATTITELSGWGIPAILVPYPYATGGHQKKNAMMMVEAGAAIIVEEELFNHRRLDRLLDDLISDEEGRKRMADAAFGLARHEAARDIALKVLNMASEGERTGE